MRCIGKKNIPPAQLRRDGKCGKRFFKLRPLTVVELFWEIGPIFRMWPWSHSTRRLGRSPGVTNHNIRWIMNRKFSSKWQKGVSLSLGQTWFDLIGAELLLIQVDSLWFGPRRALIISWKSEAWLLQCLIKLFIAHEWWNNFLPTLQQCSQRHHYGDPTGKQQFNGKEEDKELSEVFISC